jgi:hypothetical protein
MALYVRTEDLRTVAISEAGQRGVDGSRHGGYFHSTGKLYEEGRSLSKLAESFHQHQGGPQAHTGIMRHVQLLALMVDTSLSASPVTHTTPLI